MILATSALHEALACGDIVCTPPPRTLQGAHINVHLGRYYWLMRPTLPAHVRALRPTDADPRAWFQLFDADASGGVITLPSGAFALLHTEEFIGDVNGKYVPMLDTCSTLARFGLSSHENAGAGDPLFHSRWTLEVRNNHPFTVELDAGMRIGNVSFYVVAGIPARYDGRYNLLGDDWTPNAMLPRSNNL